MEDKYYTKQRVLQMAACQGNFIIDQQGRQVEEKQDTATELARDGLLKHISVDKGIITYRITDKGKDHLKELKGQTPKHKPTITTTDIDPDELSLEGIISKRLQVLRSAKRRGLDFNLTDANVRSLLKKKHCHYTGHEFDTDLDPLNVRTFERVNDTKGYVQGNVVVVTLRANRIKNMLMEQDNEYNIGVEGFIMMAEQIKKHQ